MSPEPRLFCLPQSSALTLEERQQVESSWSPLQVAYFQLRLSELIQQKLYLPSYDPSGSRDKEAILAEHAALTEQMRLILSFVS